MKLLTLLILTTSLIHVDSLVEMATVPSLVGSIAGRLESWDGDQMVGEVERAAQDRQRYPRLAGLPEISGSFERFEDERARSFTGGYFGERVRVVKSGWLAPANSSAANTTKEVKDCDCENCDCPIHDVCKAGDCQKNYAVFLTAKWCGACRTMYPTIEKLKAAGYIIYVVDADANPEVLRKYKVGSLPTILFFDKGKLQETLVGVTSGDDLKKRLRLRKEQPDAEDNDSKPTDYWLF